MMGKFINDETFHYILVVPRLSFNYFVTIWKFTVITVIQENKEYYIFSIVEFMVHDENFVILW